MGGRIRALPGTIVLACIAVSSTALAQPRVLYAESIQLTTAQPVGTGARKIAPAQRTSFRAFGRSFNLTARRMT